MVADVYAPQSKGWGIAIAIMALAVALTAGAYMIHLKTFCQPTDPTCVRGGGGNAGH